MSGKVKPLVIRGHNEVNNTLRQGAFMSENKFIHLRNVLINPANIDYLSRADAVESKVTIYFSGGMEVSFYNEEAEEVWKTFNGTGWHEKDD
jgi:hypothetical protein